MGDAVEMPEEIGIGFIPLVENCVERLIEPSVEPLLELGSDSGPLVGSELEPVIGRVEPVVELDPELPIDPGVGLLLELGCVDGLDGLDRLEGLEGEEDTAAGASSKLVDLRISDNSSTN